MPTTNKLTDAKCKAIKPADKPVKAFDGEGLHLFVTPLGAKVWRVAYRLNGKPQQKSLGPYPAVSLAEARRKRDELKAALRDGADPMAGRRPARPIPSFEACARAYLASCGDLSTGYVQNATRGLEMHVFPAITDKPITSLTHHDVLHVLDVLDAKGKHAYVRKVRIWMGSVFKHAAVRHPGLVNLPKLIEPKVAFGRAKVKHFASVPLQAFPVLWRRVMLEGDLQSVLAFRFLAMTWVRTQEMRFARWDEFDGPLWRISADRMKMKRDHLVPLPKQAMPLLKQLKLRAGRSPYVFPSERREDRPISENAVLALLDRCGYKGQMTGHGLRSIASTWANEQGRSPDAIEWQLAHVNGDDVRGAYNHATYLPERRQLLQDYADWLDSLTTA